MSAPTTRTEDSSLSDDDTFHPLVSARATGEILTLTNSSVPGANVTETVM